MKIRKVEIKKEERAILSKLKKIWAEVKESSLEITQVKGELILDLSLLKVSHQKRESDPQSPHLKFNQSEISINLVIVKCPQDLTKSLMF